MNQDYGVVTAPDTVRIERLLPGSVERVWSYLTDPAKRATWFAGGPMELRPGGKVELRFHNNQLTPGDDAPPPKYAAYGGEISMTGRITAIEPPHRLVYTWNEEGGSASEVEFQLAERGDKTRLVLTHRRLRDRGAMLSVSGGWHAHLAILLARLEERDPPKFWREHTRLEAEYDKRIPSP